MSQEEKNTTFLMGMVIGSTIATVTTLLLTPRNGKENRQIVQKTSQALPEMAEDLASTLQLQSQRLSGKMLKKWNYHLTRFQYAIGAGIEASRNYNSEHRQ